MENSTTTTNMTHWEEPRALAMFRLILGINIALVGVVGNILVWIVITTNMNTTKPRNICLLSLAAADLGVLLMNYPIALSKVGPTQLDLGAFFCLYISPATETFFCASTWSIAAIAVDRYRNIVGAHSLRRQASRKTPRIEVVAIWLSSFLASSLPLYMVTTYKDGRCGPAWKNPKMERAYNLFLAVVLYVLPLSVIGFTYVRIGKRLSRSIQFNQRLGQEIRGPLPRTLRKRRHENERIKRILTPLVILFATAMLPITVLRLVEQYYPTISLESFVSAYHTAVMCVVINSALNPILYYIVSGEFRLAYRQTINRLCKSCWKPLVADRSLKSRFTSPRCADSTRVETAADNGSRPLPRLTLAEQ